MLGVAARRLRTALAALLLASAVQGSVAATPGDPRRGEYLAHVAGCVGCHTEDRKGAPPYAGGRALKTPFGVFFGPNITPDPKAGIGSWTEADFVRALRLGRRPDGAHYYPAFPYPSFTKITDADLRDLWAYLRTVPPNNRASREHDLAFPYGFRFPLVFWKWLYFRPGAFSPTSGASPAVNRGAYLVQALAHCGECHTPRNWIGGPRRSLSLAGGRMPDGKKAPNLTPAGIGHWSEAEIREFLQTGVTPDGDTVSETMDEVIRNSTSRLVPQDLDAMIAYLRSLPAVSVK